MMLSIPICIVAHSRFCCWFDPALFIFHLKQPTDGPCNGLLLAIGQKPQSGNDKKGVEKMLNLLAVIGNFGFIGTLWLFLVVFIIHELEEWNIAQFERRNFIGLPSFHTKKNARLWIGVICTVALVWCAIATLPGNPSFAAYLFLPAIMLAVGNAFQHIFWALHFRQYAPGLISAVILLIPIASYAVFQAVHLRYVPLWYPGTWAVLVFALLAHTVSAGNEVTPPIRTIYRIGDWVARRLSIFSS